MSETYFDLHKDFYLFKSRCASKDLASLLSVAIKRVLPPHCYVTVNVSIASFTD
jgi:hypothetical protein